MPNSSKPNASRTFLELLFDAMTTTGIKSIDCSFSGAGDSGDTDTPEYHFKRLRRRKNGPPIQSNQERKSDCFKIVSSGLLLLGANEYNRASTLDELISAFFDEHICPNLGDWYNNEGGQGSFTFDLAARKVCWDCTYNTEEEETREEISIALDAPEESSVAAISKWLPENFPTIQFFRQLLEICAETGTIKAVNSALNTDSDWGHLRRMDGTYEYEHASQEASSLPEAAVRQLLRDHGFDDQSDDLRDLRRGYALLHSFMEAQFGDSFREDLDKDEQEKVTLNLDVPTRTLKFEKTATIQGVSEDSDSGEITLDDDDSEVENAA
jgi:hypothetical protein